MNDPTRQQTEEALDMTNTSHLHWDKAEMDAEFMVREAARAWLRLADVTCPHCDGSGIEEGCRDHDPECCPCPYCDSGQIPNPELIVKWCNEHDATWHSDGGFCDRGYAVALLLAGNTDAIKVVGECVQDSRAVLAALQEVDDES